MGRVLIGLNGKKGSGKDTAGAYLVEKHGFTRLSFAGPLKVSAAAALGFDPPLDTTFEDWKNDPDVRVKIERRANTGVDYGTVYSDISVREFLQRYGTEAHRDVFGADFWTRILIESMPEEGKFVITDARFVNECSAVRAAGGRIVRIDRPGTDSEDTHASEDDLPEELVDVVVNNNGTIPALGLTLDLLVAFEGLAVEPVST